MDDVDLTCEVHVERGDVPQLPVQGTGLLAVQRLYHDGIRPLGEDVALLRELLPDHGDEGAFVLCHNKSRK